MEHMNSDWFDWRSDCTKIQDVNGHLLKSGLYSDVTFIIVEDDSPNASISTVIKAHQFILKARSPVFETMFNETWNSSNPNGGADNVLTKKTPSHALEVKLVDTNAEYFNAFLKFLYTDYFKDGESKELVLGLLYLAHKYIVAPLAGKCSAYLEKSICLRNVVEIYQVGELFQQFELRDAAFEFMLRYSRALASEPHFVEIDESLLKKLMANDYVQIEEINLFRAVLQWANHKLSQREGVTSQRKAYATILKDIIPLVRFTRMEPEEFSLALEMAPAGMLDNEEIINVYKHLTMKISKALLPKLRFETRKRHLRNDEETFPQKYTVSLYLYDESCDRNRLHYIYGPRGRIHDENLQFTTNQDILINGIGLYGPAQSPKHGEYSFYNHQVDIAIYSVEVGSENPRPVIARFRRNQLVHADYEVPFDPPVRIQKDRLYHIQLAFQGEETKHGVSRLSTVKVKCAGQLMVFNLVSPQLAEGLHTPPPGRIRSINFQLAN